MGPCRIRFTEGPGSRGICGASPWTIVALSVGTLILTGAASHCEHGRHIAHTLLAAAKGRAPDYHVTDSGKLRKVAERVEIETAGKSDPELAGKVARLALRDFERLPGDGEDTWTKTTITRGRYQKYLHCNVLPSGIHGTISDLLAQAHVGDRRRPG